MKKQNMDVSAVFEEMKKLSDEMKEDEDKLAEIDKKLEMLLLSVPNLPSKTTPIGKDDSETLKSGVTENRENLSLNQNHTGNSVKSSEYSTLKPPQKSQEHDSTFTKV